ncbi:hypothetical protein [Nocardia brevicatena]|uniref:hypothetical protein n=1 Tax=Nocardia brevicatena TaxID=37327 RepID=UPI00030C36A6|nr:hypothetical protein [Nocardia brevicatena]
MISIGSLARYRRRHERLVERVAETRLPTRAGDFTALGYRAIDDGGERIVLVHGDITGPEPVLTRVHSECVFGSCRCDCRSQLVEAMERITTEGRGW